MEVSIFPTQSEGIRLLTSEQSRHLKQVYPDLPVTLDRCITCKGAKVFRWYAPHSRTEVVDYTCPCADQFVLHRRLLWSGIIETYQVLGWDDFYDDTDTLRNLASEYFDHADAYIGAGFGMILHGSKGNGKSMLAYLCLKALIMAGHDCYAIAFDSMIDAMTEGWDDKDARRFFNSRIRNAGILLIDDLGREHNKMKAGSVGVSMFESVVRHRVGRSKPTFITTNMTSQEIAGGYGGHTMSLLTERYLDIPVEGANRRNETNERVRAEIRAGLQRPIVLA